MPYPYERITFRGRTFDRITARGVEHWEYCLGKLVHAPGPIELPIMQGPYSTAIAQSGSTHAGSGAVDVGCPQGVTWGQVAWSGRLAAWFASWRTPDQGPWGNHAHGIQVGNVRVSTAAAQQVWNWENYDDAGLVGNDKDLMRDPEPVVPFRFPLGVVNLERAAEEFRKTKGWTPRRSVRHIQSALNLKTPAQLTVDGIAGPRTRRALGSWEAANGGDGDGIPGGLLWLLGAGRFEVR